MQVTKGLGRCCREKPVIAGIFYLSAGTGPALRDKVVFGRDSSGLRETVSHFRERSQF